MLIAHPHYTFEIDDARVTPGLRLASDAWTALADTVAHELPDAPRGLVNVAFVSDAEIQALNRDHRGKDAVTDVLSFADPDAALSHVLGDIIIDDAQAIRQAHDGDIALEFSDLAAHGFLHLLGFDHERDEDAQQMFALQDRCVAAML